VDNWFHIGAAATVSDLKNSPEMNAAFPLLQQHLKLVSSTPIRNMATIAGNLVNASPIGDMTVFLLALDAQISLKNEQGNTRELALKDFYKGYKTLDKTPDEMLTAIRFRKPETTAHFNFEKVCKRQHLDIASVNSAMSLTVNNGVITDAQIAVGGVAAVPFYLKKTSESLKNKPYTEGAFEAANAVMQTEINPISDVRGAANYKRLLAKQLLLAHFHELNQLAIA
jgi:xanthine dehydrogenase small subunit